MDDPQGISLEVLTALLEKQPEENLPEGATRETLIADIAQAAISDELTSIDTPVAVGESDNIRNSIQKMRIPEKIKAGLMGNSVCRAILIREPNRVIQQAVLKNPRITLTEIEELSRNTNAADHVLRTIAENKQWTSQYKVKLGLVTNPRTPQDISLKWIRYLQMNDVRNISRSKSVPSIVATIARKMVADASGS